MTFLELVGQLKEIPCEEIRRESEGYYEFVISSQQLSRLYPIFEVILEFLSNRRGSRLPTRRRMWQRITAAFKSSRRFITSTWTVSRIAP